MSTIDPKGIRLFIGDQEVTGFDDAEFSIVHRTSPVEVIRPSDIPINCRCSVISVSDEFCNQLEFFGPTQMESLNQLVRYLWWNKQNQHHLSR